MTYNKYPGDSMSDLGQCLNLILGSHREAFKHKNESVNVLEASTSQRGDFSRSGTYVEIKELKNNKYDLL